MWRAGEGAHCWVQPSWNAGCRGYCRTNSRRGRRQPRISGVLPSTSANLSRGTVITWLQSWLIYMSLIYTVSQKWDVSHWSQKESYFRQVTWQNVSSVVAFDYTWVMRFVTFIFLISSSGCCRCCCIVTLPTGAVAEYCNEHVCLCVYVCLCVSVCWRGYLRNDTRNLYQIFCACCLSP